MSTLDPQRFDLLTDSELRLYIVELAPLMYPMTSVRGFRRQRLLDIALQLEIETSFSNLAVARTSSPVDPELEEALQDWGSSEAGPSRTVAQPDYRTFDFGDDPLDCDTGSFSGFAQPSDKWSVRKKALVGVGTLAGIAAAGAIGYISTRSSEGSASPPTLTPASTVSPTTTAWVTTTRPPGPDHPQGPYNEYDDDDQWTTWSPQLPEYDNISQDREWMPLPPGQDWSGDLDFPGTPEFEPTSSGTQTDAPQAADSGPPDADDGDGAVAPDYSHYYDWSPHGN